MQTEKHIYLENSGVEINGYTFYGTPNTIAWLPEMSNLAFSTEKESLRDIFNKIPDNLDFLLSHTSPYNINDCGMLGDGSEDIGNETLTEAIQDKDIRYIFCGHIHTGNHVMGKWRGKKIVNVSYCKEDKIPAYYPYILEL